MRGNDKNLDDVFDALANTHRRSIIYRLSLQPASISQLAKLTKLSLPAIHKHIKVLEATKLIERKKVGRVNFLALNTDGLLKMQKWLMQYQAHWGSQQQTLENYVASIQRAEENNK